METLKILLSGNKKLQYYVDAVNNTGGSAVAAYLPEVDTSYDGLILCGGNDTDPSYYGEAICGAVDIDYDRDRAEFALLDAYVKAGKPVLGICRGHQLINIYFGGSLYQDLDNAAEHSSGESYDLTHTVRAGENSMMRQFYGAEFVVNSYHHQAIKQLGSGLSVTMMSGDGRVIEGIKHDSLPVFGVQWHPERMCFSARREDTVDGAAVFAYFMQMCREQKEKDHVQL